MQKQLITYTTFTEDPFKTYVPNDKTKGASQVLQWAYDTFGNSILYACSFGVEGIVLIDLISKVKRDAKIIFLDTGVHFKETYELINKVKEKYPELQIEMKQPSLSLIEQTEQYGESLWDKNPNQCCYLRKIKPLEDALHGAQAWISGLRREQSLSRSKTNFVNKDERFQSIKVCPLIHWSWNDVWEYVNDNDLPYNLLHDQGYPSIGCAPCTKPVDHSSDSREGRWMGSNKTECGLHTNS
ncbi:phosphoadenylyl-sulfate reductase [Radiobacillus sp. PE A8.2]|uniref:phosphoadenylyl-sulfate reductase n=1 Tax=Radiobacillus sp. PE A8.2 TaxID=3380349 RepID=UPI00388F2308